MSVRYRRLRAGALISALVGAGLAPIVANPAYAATCRTAGHTYITVAGQLYISGYEGDERFGVPFVTIPRGASYKIGGNGIQPRDPMRAKLFRRNADNSTGFPVGDYFFINTAGNNCVVNEHTFTNNDQPGAYVLFTDYIAGNSGAGVAERVAFIDVV